MNKIIYAFIATCLLGLVTQAYAQDLKMEIYNTRGELIKNGASLVAVASGSSAKLLATDSLLIKNVSEETIKLKVRKIDYSIVDNTFSIFTALEQNIGADENITTNYHELVSGAMLPTEAFFKGTYYPQATSAGLGTSSIIYSFISVDENDQVLDSVYVYYSFSNTSVAPLNEDGDYVYNKEVLVNGNADEVIEYPVLLKNHTLEAVSYRVGKTVLESEEGQDFYFKFGGVEYSADENTSNASGVAIEAGQVLEGENGFIAMFDANSIDGNEFLPKVKYKFFNRVAGNDADYVTLVYNPSGVGFSEIDSYEISDPYPNPATDYFSVNHKIQDFQTAEMKLYNSVGQLILIHPVQKGSQKSVIYTSGLSEGVYYLNIEVNGQALGSEKVIIK